MRPINPRFLNDRVIFKRPEFDLDSQHAPTYTDKIDGTEMTVAVDPLVIRGAIDERRFERHDTVEAEIKFNIICATKPPSQAEDERVVWTHHRPRWNAPWEKLDPPVLLRTMGPPIPSGSIWTVNCISNTTGVPSPA